tara:strand:+ start:54 stop:377 length:324 start_codon:yes stop_codon:yes gene_type:complete
MKNLIIKWLGLDKLKAEVSKLEDDTFKVVEELVRSEVDNVKYDIQSDVKYELEDDFLSKDDATSQFEEVLADYELDDLTTKVHQIDDRLTEMVAGYKLEVQLIKEDF